MYQENYGQQGIMYQGQPGVAQQYPQAPGAYGVQQPPMYQQGYGGQQQQVYQPQQQGMYGQPQTQPTFQHAYGGGAPTPAMNGATSLQMDDPRRGGGGGGFGAQDWVIEEGKLLNENIEIGIRMAFIRKVYSILACQLAISFGIALYVALYKPAATWLYANSWVMIVSSVVMIATVCTLSCVPSTARKSPTNFILLGVLSVAVGAMLGYACAAVDTSSFAIAAGMTAAVTLAITIFSFQTKIDFTGFRPYAFVFFILLLFTGLICAFIRTQWSQILYGSLGACLFSFYLIMDTQMIVGGKHRKYEFSIDDYCFAALALYLDIINLFMYILRIVAAARQ